LTAGRRRLCPSIANGVQNFSAQAVGDVQRFTAHITDTTNPPPVSSGGTSHSGGHCACAGVGR